MTERYTNIIWMQYVVKEQRDLKFLQFQTFGRCLHFSVRSVHMFIGQLTFVSTYQKYALFAKSQKSKLQVVYIVCLVSPCRRLARTSTFVYECILYYIL